MSAMIIDGKAVAAEIKGKIKEEVAELVKIGKTPGLAVIIVGDDPASRVYVNNKKKACAEVGIYSLEYALSADTSQDKLISLIGKLNKDPSIHGILVQLPLPSHIDDRAVINAISPDKDVDAFHPANVGHIMIGDFRFAPCTPAGIIELINKTGISCEGKECVIIGRSNIVGKPMSMLMLKKNATVTVCHSKTKDLASVVKRADIVIAAAGKAKMITADMIKPGAVVIDVGINRGEDGKLCGDVDFENVKEIAGAITPVPGGVGPMTIAMLMKNTLTAGKYYADR